jgi:enoyl-CoA hydratase/carnithine racemase
MSDTRIIDTGTDELRCEISQRVATITLNRPQARNSLSNELTPALRRMIADCGADPDVGAIMLTGAGDAFCAGGNVKGMAAKPAQDVAQTAEPETERSLGEAIADLCKRQRTLTGALVALRKPTLAALPGPAAGAGMALALACDLRIASDAAFMTTGYAKIGLSGDYGIAWLLTRLVGPSRARELMFLSEKLDAARCERLGLVNRVIPAEGFREAAFALALQLANGPPIAFEYMKDTLDHAIAASFPDSLDFEADRMVRSARTIDHREAVAAFIAKRPPVFHGRRSRQPR